MTSTSRLAVLAPLGANACPTCRADHEQLDKFWACPRHGHKLTKLRDDGDFEQYACPAYKCMYVRSAPRKPRSPSKGDPMTTVQTRPSVAVAAIYARTEHLAQLLPPGLDVGSFAGSAAAALYNNAKLMEAAEESPDSLMIALTECAALGHLPGSKEYYLTPRKDHGKPKVLGIEGYRGIVKRMYNSGLVESVTVREVCAKDHFEFTEGVNQYPIHRFGNSEGITGAAFFGEQGSVDRGPMVGVYAYAKLLTGGWSRVSFLSRADWEAARASGGWKEDDAYSPWNRLDGGPDHPELRGRSMVWKTALKRLEPWILTNAEDQRQGSPSAVQVPRPQPPLQVPAAPPAAPAVPAQGRRQALPAARQKPAQRQQAPPSDVVTKSLRAAIGKQFDRLGLEDAEERETYVRKLNQDAEGELTEHQLRFALGALGEKDPDGSYAVPDLAALVDLCSPDPGDQS